MSEAKVHRQRLSAILAADGVGFSRLIAQDEEFTVRALDAARDAFRAAVLAEGGRVIDMAGDSILAVFETAAGAVTAALQAQQAVESLAVREASERRLRFRVGLQLGDVIEKPDGTVYGNGVNIASRLPPPGICRSGGHRDFRRGPQLRAQSHVVARRSGRAAGEEHRRSGTGVPRQLAERLVGLR